VTALLRLLFLVPIGYIAAIVAAGFMMAFGLFGYDQDPEVIGYFVASVIIWTFWAGALAFVPAIIAIVLAEAFGWRSILYYLAVGGGIALFGERLVDHYHSLDFADQRTVVMLAAGFVGGFAYWLIAGRLAGTGSEPVTPDSRLPSREAAAPPPPYPPSSSSGSGA
jgi:hypothetical protein